MPREAKTLGTAATRGRKDKRYTEVHDGTLQNVVAGLGTGRDKMSYTEYLMPIALSQYQLGAIYRGSSLGRKTVDIPASDMTREWRTVMFDVDPAERTNDKRMFEVEQLEKRMGLQAKCEEALRWADLYGGSVIIIGTKQSEDKPLDPEKVRKDDLQYLIVMDRNRISPAGAGLVKDPADPDFGTPEFYILNESTVRVHHSRVVRFEGNPLPWDVWVNNGRWGDSVLQAAYSDLRNADTTTSAIATMMFEANVDVITAPELTDILARKDGEQILIKRFQTSQLMKSFNRTLLLGTGETYEKKGNNFANLDAIMQRFFVKYASAVDIPVTRLFGTSATGLNANGDNDVRNYYDGIKLKQKSKLRPRLERIDQVLVRSALGRMPDDYRFEFNSLWQISDTEKATIEKTRAERDQIYVSMGAITEGTVAKDLKENGTYKNLTDEDVQLIDDLAREALENPPEPPPMLPPQPGQPPEPGQPPQQGQQQPGQPPQGTPPEPTKTDEEE